jgi:hypothetical protein
MIGLSSDDNDNPIITRPHIVLTDGRQQRQPNVNTICGRVMVGLSLFSSVCQHNIGGIMIGLSLSSVSKHNMWSYYDWLVVVADHNTTTYCVY